MRRSTQRSGLHDTRRSSPSPPSDPRSRASSCIFGSKRKCVRSIGLGLSPKKIQLRCGSVSFVLGTVIINTSTSAYIVQKAANNARHKVLSLTDLDAKDSLGSHKPRSVNDVERRDALKQKRRSESRSSQWVNELNTKNGPLSCDVLKPERSERSRIDSSNCVSI